MSYSADDTQDNLNGRPTPAPRRNLESGRYRPTPMPRSSRSWRTISEAPEDEASVNASMIGEEQRLEQAVLEAQQELDRAKERLRVQLSKTPDDSQMSVTSGREYDSGREGHRPASAERYGARPASDLRQSLTSARRPTSEVRRSPTPTRLYVQEMVKLDFTIFDGKHEEFPFFETQVKEALDLRYSETQILRHLKERLRGAAFDAVHGALLTGGTFEDVWTILKERFGDPQVIVNRTVRKLIDIPPLKDGDIDALERFSTDVSNAIAIIRHMGQSHELNSLQVMQVLTSKLPRDSRHEWGSYGRSKVDGGTLTCDLFAAFLKAHIKDRRFCTGAGYHPLAGESRNPKRVGKDQKTSRPRQTTCASTDQLKCYFCDRPHYIQRCDQFRAMGPDERRRWVEERRGCLRCLSTSHSATSCHRKRPCGLEGCRELHHRMLHGAVAAAEVIGVTHGGTESRIMMKTCVINVVTPNGKRRCRAFLDEGSSVTLMDRSLADELRLCGPKSTMNIKTVTGVRTMETVTVGIQIENPGNGRRFKLRHVTCVRDLNLTPPAITTKRLKTLYPELRELYLPELDEAPKILIGLDQAELIAAREVHKTKNGPLLQRTLLGWTVAGKVVVRNDTVKHSPEVNFLHTDDPWSTEQFGCKYQFEVPFSPEDRKSEDILSSEVYHDGTRWVAPLLRRDRDQSFPPSRQMAQKRAEAFEKRMDKSERLRENPSLSEMTKVRMAKMISDGHFRKLTEEEASQEPKNTWYLPLMAVTHPNKPNKVRLVLDAAARSHGMSLNDTLMQGPQNMNSLIGVLCRWRENRVALTSDVVAMFSQIVMDPRDRPSLRFLWRDDRQNGDLDVYESPVLIFGAACSPSIAGYCYRRTAADFGGGDPLVTRAVNEDSYVDDLMTGTETEAEAVQLVGKLSDTLRHGGFELGPWTSNSPSVLSQLKPEQCNDDDFSVGRSDDHRALGVVWKPSRDLLTYRLYEPPEAATKRTVMSTVMSVFDPIGFLTGWLLQGKLLLQQLWKRDLAWDDRLPADIDEIWQKWTDDLRRIHELRLPRHLFNNRRVTAVDLHMFCDASEKGFSAVLYYRWKTQDGGFHVSFVGAKSRVAPTKKLTIPRLELQAAVLGTRMIAALKKEARVKIESTTCWSDSKNVLAWIKSSARRYHVFVANRVAEIRDVTRPEDWRHVPTELNVADAASRGQTLADLRPAGKWVCGPEFLQMEDNRWPATDVREEEALADDPETKSVLTTAVQPEPDPSAVQPDLARSSRWLVAVRTMAAIRRWLTRHRDGTTGEFTPSEMEHAEKSWIKAVQHEQFESELRDLKAGRAVNTKSKIADLSPVLIDGIICLDSRIKRSPELSPTARQPPILLRDHRYVELYIQHLHERMGHRAHEAVLTELRQHYWVPQARRAIRTVTSRCQICRVRKSQPRSSLMAPLPSSRVTMLRGAFYATGMDYFGPILSRRGRATVKLWGVIFRCLATKAIHLELTDSLDTQATLMAISRFQARRGNVRELWSDNGTNLRAAEKELRRVLEELNQDEIRRQLGVDKIVWSFTPPSDPEAGGVWERSVRTVKETLRAILKEHKPRYEVLLTLFCEVEKILNSTPLFHIPVDPSDDDPLTPFHFLIGRATPSYPVGSQTEQVDLRKRWEHAQQLSDAFWQRWVRRYLPTLSTRPKWKHQQADVKVDDVVVIADHRHPRGLWPKGVVEGVHRGADGIVRSAEVRTRHGTLHRPVRKLVVLNALTR